MMEYSVFILLVCACLDVSDLLLDFVLKFYNLPKARCILAADYSTLNV